MTSNVRPQTTEEAIAPPKCLDCAYYRGPKQYGFGLTCKAYPEGIPEAILEGKIDHNKPYSGDHGIQFKSKKEQKKRRKLPKRKPTFIGLLLTIATAYTLLGAIEYNWRWAFLLIPEGIVGLLFFIARNWREVVVGMTTDTVLKLWGKPDHVSTSEDLKEGFHVLSVTREIWGYTNPPRMVFFEDGLVSEVEQPEH